MATKIQLTSQAVNLAGLLDYQNNSIVSREIVNKSAGTITVFAFDKGQGLSEHTSPFDAFLYILDGEALITISGKPIKAHKGETVLMPGNQPHSIKAANKFKMVLVMIKA
jgi:quercetin dioxygenase-like cupin family protein